MAGKTRELKTRIKAVGNIQRITKTMQMIATARFQAMQRRATSAQAYSRKIAEVVGDLAGAAGSGGAAAGDHPLLQAPDPAAGRSLLLVLTSNRGLCGAYNANVLRTATAYLRQNDQPRVDVEMVGKKGRAFFKFSGIEVADFHAHIEDSPAFEDVHRLAEHYMDAFTQGRYDRIEVCYMAFETMSRQRAKIMQLLPMQPPAADGSDQPAQRVRPGSRPAPRAVQYDFSPSAEELLGELLPVTVKTQLYQCFLEAVLSEQIARMVAMKAATDAAGKMKKTLNRDYNRARQSAITTELTEIISGAMALE